MARDLTVKQRKFVMALIGPAAGNQMLAAKTAGYRGHRGQLATQGSVNMKNPKVQQLLREKYESMAESSLEIYSQALRATKRQAFLTKDAEIIYSGPEPNWKVMMEAADRVLEYVQQYSEGGGREEVDVEQQKGEDSESRTTIPALNPTDQNLVARTAQIEERLADVQQQLSSNEDSDGSARPHEN